MCRSIPLLFLTLIGLCADAQTLTVLQCRGLHGEPVYTTRPQCPGAVEPLIVHSLEIPPAVIQPVPVAKPAAPPASSRRSTGRGGATSEPASWRCQSGTAVWYQHQPCAGSTGKSSRKEQVRGERVSRSHACREISRPAAALRRGSEHDQRAGPYERAVGRDPCR